MPTISSYISESSSIDWRVECIPLMTIIENKLIPELPSPIMYREARSCQ